MYGCIFGNLALGDQAGNYATPTRLFSFQFAPLVVTYKTFPQGLSATKDNWISSHWNPTVLSSTLLVNSGKRAAMQP